MIPSKLKPGDEVRVIAPSRSMLILGEDCKKLATERLEALGLKESGLDTVIRESYDLLGLMSFLTAGEPEVRAWTIKKGTKAPEAAGKIHSDIQRGFIKAEIVSYNDLMREGSMVAAREKGLVRSEGKEYIMQDGDIVLFRFNV
jgi:ribosome-binding ATPase YchF (GTP1/OBG family)